MEENDLRGELEKVFSNLNPEDTESLAAVGHEARSLILQTAIPNPSLQKYALLTRTWSRGLGMN